MTPIETIGQVELLASFWTIAGPIGPLQERPEVSPWPLRERVEVAREAGFTGIGLLHEDLLRYERQIGLGGIRDLLGELGVRHLELEMIFDFAANGERRQRAERVKADLLRAAAVLEPRHIKVGSGLEQPWLPRREFARGFGRLCDEAAAAGTKVALEPMPFAEFPTPLAALAAVELADRPNGGLMLDVWHVARSRPQPGFDDLRELPGELIFGVELSDAPAAAAEPLIAETLDRRLLCGDGDLDIAGFAEAVRAAGFGGPFGVEILSAEHRGHGLREQARRAFETTIAQFDATSRTLY